MLRTHTVVLCCGSMRAFMNSCSELERLILKVLHNKRISPIHDVRAHVVHVSVRLCVLCLRECITISGMKASQRMNCARRGRMRKRIQKETRRKETERTTERKLGLDEDIDMHTRMHTEKEKTGCVDSFYPSFYEHFSTIAVDVKAYSDVVCRVR